MKRRYFYNSIVAISMLLIFTIEVHAGLLATLEVEKEMYIYREYLVYHFMELLKIEKELLIQLKSTPSNDRKKVIESKIENVVERKKHIKDSLIPIEQQLASNQRLRDSNIKTSFTQASEDEYTENRISERISEIDEQVKNIAENIQQGNLTIEWGNEKRGLKSLPEYIEYVKKRFETSKTWAVIVGIDDYSENKNGYKPLPYAVRDAQGIKDSLIVNWGILEDQIITLYNKQATKKCIEELIGDKFLQDNKLKESDRLIIYLSGHGETLATPTQDEYGFFIPYDGQKNSLYSTCISMRQIYDFSKLIPARQLLFIIDACYSGLAGIIYKGDEDKKELSKKVTDNQIRIFMERPGRQIMTAGTSRETALMGQQWDEHSVYTFYLLQGLKGAADYNSDTLITAHELHLFVETNVSQATYGKQNPQLFSLGLSEGQFIFYREGNK